MKENRIPMALLILILAAAFGTVFIWFFFRGFGSRGVSNIQMAFDINGEILKAGHSVYVRHGECYYLPLHETAGLLQISEESHFKGVKLSMLLDNDSYEYYFNNRRLLKNGEELKDCGNAFMMRERTAYVSTLFLEKALGCRILKGTEEENKLFISNGSISPGDFDYSWAHENRYIAHALGGIDGKDYSNSLEAFRENYEKGFRVFEADLEYSLDGELVLIHSWERATLKSLFNMDVPEDNVETPLTFKEFKEQKIYNGFTPLSFKELLLLMKEHSDMYLVLDGKYDDEENVRKEYEDLVKSAKEVDPALLDRMIPQLYNERMYDWIMSIHPFKSLIFSWYRYGSASLEPEPLFDFCEERGIKICAMKDALENALLDREAFRRDIMVFVYTVNETRDRDRLFNNGVRGIYTDFLYE